MRIAFDIGGVLSKYPQQLRPLVNWLRLASAAFLAERFATRNYEPVEVFVISDMHDREKMVGMVQANGFDVDPDNIHSADYKAHGELCKAVLCEQLGIDILIDDHGGYVCTPGSPPVRLLVMPDPARPYYHDDWKTDGSEGDFGRRRNPAGSKRPPEDR